MLTAIVVDEEDCVNVQTGLNTFEARGLRKLKIVEAICVLKREWEN